MGTKQNPGRFDCYQKAEPDEPIFVLLARDPLAPALVRPWARQAYQRGEDLRKVEEAMRCADQMETWSKEG